MTLREFQFPYGGSFLTARIPETNILTVLERQHGKGLKDEAASILKALRSPIGRPPLTDCVNKKDKVVVIVTDNTRACPDDRLLPVILPELERKIPRENIKIIVAQGLHAPMNRDELVKKLGKYTIEKYNVINHDADMTISLGATSRGTPVEVNKWVVAADFRISTGFIEPHFFAGFSGGSKSIFPGVSSRRAIFKNHGYNMIEHSLARAGVLQGNPIHEDIVEQAKIAKLNFIVNVLLNEDREITHVFAGDPVRAHEAGCEIEKGLAGVKVPEKADITITTNGGAPLDMDLYQTCKGINNAATITRDGGIIIIASSCRAGMGPEDFVKLHSLTPPAAVLQKIKREEPIGVQWQNQILAHDQLKHEVYLVSGIDDNLVRDMQMVPVHSLEEGLGKALLALGSDAKIAVMPEGPLVLPILS